jgi:hypothetical protein
VILQICVSSQFKRCSYVLSRSETSGVRAHKCCIYLILQYFFLDKPILSGLHAFLYIIPYRRITMLRRISDAPYPCPTAGKLCGVSADQRNPGRGSLILQKMVAFLRGFLPEISCTPSQRERLPLFLKKLQEMRQAEWQRQQAAARSRSITIFSRLGVILTLPLLAPTDSRCVLRKTRRSAPPSNPDLPHVGRSR